MASTVDVRGYSYFIERRESDKRWLATVTEFPELSGVSRIHNRAINRLQALVSAEVVRRYRAGEEIPAAPRKQPHLLKTLGLN
jgi:voltage-gated potassium channel Kch